MKNIILYSLLTVLIISILTTSVLVYAQTSNSTITESVKEDVRQLENQASNDNIINATLGTVITAVGGYITTKTLKDRKDKEKIQNYASETDKIIFNHVTDNYNDFANYVKIRINYIDLIYQHPEKSQYELMNMIADKVTNETYGQIEKKSLKNIIKWNVEYYGVPASDTLVSCPDPSNPIARTMTDIKKHSIPTQKPDIVPEDKE